MNYSETIKTMLDKICELQREICKKEDETKREVAKRIKKDDEYLLAVDTLEEIFMSVNKGEAVHLESLLKVLKQLGRVL